MLEISDNHKKTVGTLFYTTCLCLVADDVITCQHILDGGMRQEFKHYERKWLVDEANKYLNRNNASDSDYGLIDFINSIFDGEKKVNA